MTQKFILLIMLFLSIQMFPQKTISTQREVKRIDTEFSIDKLYNKKTGEKISNEEFLKLIRKNPNLPLERVYDNSGNVIKYLYDPENLNSTILKSSSNKTPGNHEKFPNLIFTSIDGETIKLEDLRGKMVILRMEMQADSFRFKKHEIEELDKAINQTKRKSEIEAIIIFRTSKQEVKRGFDLKDSNFKLIPNGANYQDKLNIRTFPSTIIIDKEGRLIKVFKSSKTIDLLKLLNES